MILAQYVFMTCQSAFAKQAVFHVTLNVAKLCFALGSPMVSCCVDSSLEGKESEDSSNVFSILFLTG